MFKRLQKTRPYFQDIWRHGGLILLASLLISFLVHVLSILNLGNRRLLDLSENESETIKISVRESNEDELLIKQVVETEQNETSPPKQADFSGSVNHSTQKQTRVDEKFLRPKAADVGAKGDNQLANPGEMLKKQENKQDVRDPMESLFMTLDQNIPRRPLDSSVPTMGGGKPTAGYVDYVLDQSIELGDVVDVNTAQSIFVGFFSNMRKAIELVWIYPSDAVRSNMQGVVRLQLNIQKSGKVTDIRVANSSGYEPLDKSAVEAVRLAQPFSPLPAAYEKDNLIVMMNFSYVLLRNVAH